MTRLPNQVYEFGPFRLDPEDHILYRGHEPVPLPPKVLDTLIILVRNNGRVVPKDELINQVWPDTFVEEGNLGQNIFLLRKALGESPGASPYIRTIPKRGYCFAAAVNERAAPDVIFSEHQVSSITIEEEETNGPSATEPGSEKGPSSAQPRMANLLSRAQSRYSRRAPVVAAVAILTAAVLGGYVVVRRLMIASGSDRVAPFQKIEVNKLTSTGASIDAAISPDGRYIAYVLADGGTQSLWIKQTSAATTLQIVEPSESDYSGITFSRDGNWIFYVKDNDIYETAALGGGSRKLMSNVDSAVTLSPDSQRMAFVRGSMPQGETQLVIASIDGSDQRVLARRTSPDFFRSPAWSSDGSVIACSVGTRAEAKEMTVVQVAVETGVESPLVQGRWRSIGQLAWLPRDRGLIMDASLDNTRPAQIWWISHPDGETRQITSGLENYRGVSLTADSTRLVTVRTSEVRNVWVSAAGDGRAARQVTTGTGKADHPCWTPDGKIVYSSESGGRRNIWMMDADGTNQKQLTFDSELDDQPAVSADGKFIIFVSERGAVASIWIAGIDGSNPKRLTSGATDFDPAFALDNQSVVFVRYALGSPAIWRTSTNGGAPVQLTRRLSRHPVVSPDGKLIAVYYWEEQEGSPFNIALIPVGGGPPIKSFAITRSTILPTEFHWTPDGSAISYPVHGSGETSIWRQPLDGRPATEMIRFEGDQVFYFDWSRDGRQIVCSRGSNVNDAVVIAASP